MAQQMSSSACEQQQTIPSDLKIKTGIKRSRTEATIEKEEEGKEEDKKEEKEETNPINKKKRKSAKKGGGTVPNLWQKNGKSGDKQQEEGNNCYFDGTTMRKYLPPLNLEVTVKNGIRYLPPYWGVFRGYSKRRWVGKTIAEVYATEFRNLLHPLYAKAACRKGRVFVNKCPIFDANHCIRDNEFFIHINHRHETEIPNLPIQILAENDDVLVVNKPAGLPVHPCGNYALHTVLGLLRREYGRANELLSCLYRLDRTTTGVLMFAKNQQYDSHFKKLVRDRKLAKEYVCKVEGKFPDGGEIICGKKNFFLIKPRFFLDAPLGVLCPQLGLRCVRPDGQEALSSFSLLRYLPAENASVVSCTIVTGRTHQIRVHLQFLGHPIIGDRFYNDETWGPDKGKAADYGERTMDQLADDIGKRHSKSHWILERDDEYEQRLRQIGDDETCTVEEFDLKNLEADLEAMPAWDPLCWACAIKKKREMQESDWLMPLHCHRYSGDGWTYEAPLPDWALVDESGNSNSINTGGIIVNGSTTTMETVPMSTTKKRTTDPMAQPPPLTTAAGEEEERGVLNAAMSSSSS